MSMDGVLRLYFGESNLPTPEYIKQAAVRAMQDGFTFYTENAGLPSPAARHRRKLPAAASAWSSTPRREIVVTASGVQALNLGIRCALDPGRRGHGADAGVAQRIFQRDDGQRGGRRRFRTRSAASATGIDFDALEAAVTPRTRLLLYTSPSNPAGLGGHR